MAAGGARRRPRFISWPVLASGILGAVVLTLPWVFAGAGAGRLPVLAGVVAARSAAITALWVLVVVLVVILACVRVKTVVRSVLLPLAALAVIASVASLVDLRVMPEAAASGRSITVLSWNINGSLVSGQTLADEALAHHADVLVVPEINDEEVGQASAVLEPKGYRLVRRRGSQVVVFSTVGYRAADAHRYGSDPSRELVVENDEAELPPIYAVHLRIPFSRPGSKEWNREVSWLSGVCGAQRPALLVGDFNATIDNLAATPVTTACADAATEVGAQHVGSWPTAVPTFVGMPIDHVFTVGAGVHATEFTVLTDQDRSGSRHRPVLATIALPRP